MMLARLRAWCARIMAWLRRPRDPAPTQIAERRTVLAGLGRIALFFGLASRRKLLAQNTDAAAETSPEKPKALWGMVIDLDTCTACQGCVVACRQENNIPVAGPEAMAKGWAINWMDIVPVTEGSYPDLKMQFLPQPCNHCDNPPCTKVCPVGATYRTDEGIVAQIPSQCIGCRYCTLACPYTRRYFNFTEPNFSEQDLSRLNPDVSLRPKGVVEKCTFCHQRIRKVQERARDEDREVTDADVRRLPACAETCPADSIVFGNLNDPESEVSRKAKSPRAYRLLEDLGTKPKVIYLREAKWQE